MTGVSDVYYQRCNVYSLIFHNLFINRLISMAKTTP